MRYQRMMKFTPDQVRAIRMLWPRFSFRKLAKQYSVCNKTIMKIVNRHSYKEVK